MGLKNPALETLPEDARVEQEAAAHAVPALPAEALAEVLGQPPEVPLVHLTGKGTGSSWRLLAVEQIVGRGHIFLYSSSSCAQHLLNVHCEVCTVNYKLYTEDIGYYDYRPVTLLLACFISFQRYALS